MSSAQDNFQATKKMLMPALTAYEYRFARFGPTAKGVFWKSRESQNQRYVILESIFDEDAKGGGVTIHDFGCGYGALFDYLSDRPIMIDSHYIGTDMCRSMIHAANSRPNDPRASFIHGVTALAASDYTIISGTYNMNINADEEEWTDYIQASLKQLWGYTRRGLAFNMLNRDTGKKYDGLYYADPKMFIDFAKKNLSQASTITFDPPLPDFTIFVRRT